MKVGTKIYDPMHPIATSEENVNIIPFYTKKYGKTPLAIAGADRDVTAMDGHRTMGVAGDSLEILC